MKNKFRMCGGIFSVGLLFVNASVRANTDSKNPKADAFADCIAQQAKKDGAVLNCESLSAGGTGAEFFNQDPAKNAAKMKLAKNRVARSLAGVRAVNLFDGGKDAEDPVIVGSLSGGPERGGKKANMGGASLFCEVPLIGLKNSKDRSLGKVSAQVGLGFYSDLFDFYYLGRYHTDSRHNTVWQSGPEAAGAVRKQQDYRVTLPAASYLEFAGLNYQTPRVLKRFTLEVGARLGWGQTPVQPKITREDTVESYGTTSHTSHDWHEGYYTTEIVVIDGHSHTVSVWHPGYYTDTTTTGQGWVLDKSDTYTVQNASKKSSLFIAKYIAMRAKVVEGVDARVEAFQFPTLGTKQWGLKVGVVLDLGQIE
jgi:hypothetical protein